MDERGNGRHYHAKCSSVCFAAYKRDWDILDYFSQKMYENK